MSICSPPLSPAERTLRAKVAAHQKHAHCDPQESTREARAAFASRWEREADPEGILDPAERARRAEHLKKSYFAGLALKSSRARALRKAT